MTRFFDPQKALGFLAQPSFPLLRGLLALTAICLSGITNLWSVNLFFGLSFVFGTTWAYLAMSMLGIRSGILAGVVAVGVAFLQIHNPLFVFISLPEVLFVGLIHRLTRRDIIHCSVLYWITLGPLLSYFFYLIDYSPSFDQFDYLVVYMKQAVNGILNTLFGSLLVIFLRLLWPYSSLTRMQVPIHQAIFYVLITLILLPSLLMTSIHSKARYERMETYLTAKVKGRAELMSQFLQEWHGSTTPSLAPERLNELLNRLVLREGWQATVFDEKGQAIVSNSGPTPPFYIKGAVLSGPRLQMTGANTFYRDLSAPTDAPFIRWQKIHMGAIVPVQSLGWTIVAEGPTSNYAKALKIGLIENLVLMLILCFLGLFVSGFLARIIGHPIQMLPGLTSHLQQSEAASLDQIWPRSRIHEIAQLIKNYKSMQEELARRFRELKKADQAKSAFLATISHEIRTPLGAILGFSELLLKRGTEEPQSTEHLRAIRRNGEQLLSVIGDVLDLSKIEAGKLCLENLPVPFAHLIDDVVQSLRLQTEAKGICFELKKSGALPQSIETDPTRFRQILWNLTQNAIKFTSIGRISVQIHAEWQELKQQHLLSFQIQDSGIGIPEDQQEAIFQAFVQADSSMNRKYGGSGLGLVLSRRLAEAMGGKLVLSWSKAGVGSCFSFTLGLAPEAWNPSLPKADDPLQDLTVNVSLSENTSDAPQILLVDDAPDNLLLVKFLLESQGASVLCARDADEGLEQIQKQKLDLIITDIQMPRVDGYEFVRRIRAQTILTPVIAMTAHAMSDEQNRCLSAGFDAYLSKPLNTEKLFALVQDLTSTSRATRS